MASTELAALGLLAGLYHTINHAMFKALLFLGAGSLLYATHTRNMEEYGGLLRRMPWTGAFFLIGAVSISALPPTNGFVSEWLVFQSLFLSFHLPTVLLKFMLPIAAAMLALTSVLALTCFAKAFGISFLALPRSSHAQARRGSADHHAYCDGHAGGGLRVARPRAHDRRPDVGPGGHTICRYCRSRGKCWRWMAGRWPR